MISQFQYEQMRARTQANRSRALTASELPQHEGLESGLHDKILDYATSKGWAIVHSRMDKRSTVGIGTPDFILGADNGVTYWIEAKRKGGKPTIEQLGRILMLKTLGHKAAIVYSFEEFLEVVRCQSDSQLIQGMQMASDCLDENLHGNTQAAKEKIARLISEAKIQTQPQP